MGGFHAAMLLPELSCFAANVQLCLTVGRSSRVIRSADVSNTPPFVCERPPRARPNSPNRGETRVNMTRLSRRVIQPMEYSLFCPPLPSFTQRPRSEVRGQLFKEQSSGCQKGSAGPRRTCNSTKNCNKNMVMLP